MEEQNEVIKSEAKGSYLTRHNRCNYWRGNSFNS